ncbi:MAG: phospho-sugar mutase [Clostridiales bacterium]|jgi:phosphoglucomutase|nr:phospho-sugar mutase [Clostridiales bacterium]
MEAYRQWLAGDEFDQRTKDELRAIEGDEREIEDRFYRELSFGTAGLRGILGAGTNRMNAYTVGKVTQGLCDSLLAANPGARGQGIAIARDPRHMSKEFSLECALIIAANGIKAYLFDDIRPTPVLSFAVRHLGCAAGIMITASHNPSAYNGYKVYGPDGAQMSVADSERVVLYTGRLGGYGAIRRIGRGEAERGGLLVEIGKDVDDAYVGLVRKLSLRLGEIGGAARSFKIIYTPLHGTGNKLVRRVLAENGYGSVLVVREQELPDPDFSTVESPNPENRGAFDLAIGLAQREGADVIIGTDPDCDRLGAVIRGRGGEYEVLTGNQIGCLLMEYILGAQRDAGALRGNEFVIKTIVTTKLANLIAESYGVDIYEVFTGFKYICGLVKELDEFGDRRFVYGFEESNGYLAGSFVRDKDAVIASMLVAEMAAWHSTRGRTLADALEGLYAKYGYTVDDVVSYTLEGKEGLGRIAGAMDAMRKGRPAAFGSFGVRECRDYLTQEVLRGGAEPVGGTGMGETSNVLHYIMEDGSCFLVRPSGTEPKIKVYFGATQRTKEGAEALMRKFKAEVAAVVKGHLGIE